ncbi:MAG: extracellular solute-binding protein [Paenibacillaceae bacterium]
MAITSKKQIIILLIGLVLILTACNGSKTEKQSTSSSPSQSQSSSAGQMEKIPISMFASPRASVADLKTNWFTGYVEEKFGLDINWITAPSADSKDKQSLLLASGDFPEVFWNGQFSPPELMKYVQEGSVIAIDDLIKEYAPNVQKALDTIPGFKEALTAPDGRVYALPSYNYCLQCFFSNKIWINTKFLDEYGLQMPTTTEEFTNVLEVFKKNGKIPLTSAVDAAIGDPIPFLMNPFVYVDPKNYFIIKDGKVEFAPVQQGWKDGLKYINMLYQKGLIDREAFSQKNEALKKVVTEGKVGAFPNIFSGLVIDPTNPSYPDWRAMPPLKGPNGVQNVSFTGNLPNNLQFIITSKASKEQQIRIIKFMDYVYTPEGTETLNYGEEGKFWRKTKAGEMGIDGKQAMFNTEVDKFNTAGAKQNDGWDQMGSFQSKEWRIGFSIVEPLYSPNGFQGMLEYVTQKDYVGLQPQYVYPGLVWISSEENQQYSILKTNIDSFVKQQTMEFITGDMSIDKKWDEYVKDLEKLELAKYLQIAQKNMKAPFDTSGYKQDSGAMEFLSTLE